MSIDDISWANFLEVVIRRFHFLIFIVAIVIGCSHAAKRPTSIEITTAGRTDSEIQAKLRLEQLLLQYKPTTYYFTGRVVIDEKAIPHSSPVLTLHARYKDDGDRLLSLFLHEQIHWLEFKKANEFQAAIADFGAIYPNPPNTIPEAAPSPESTYRHFIVNYLELQALRKYVGAERALAVFKEPNVYRWIYGRVLADEEKISEIVRRHGLMIE